MHNVVLLSALLTQGALAGLIGEPRTVYYTGDSCPAPSQPSNGGSGGNFPSSGVQNTHTIPAFVTHTFSLAQPSDVLASLLSIAKQAPGAVSLLPNVPGAPSGSSVGGHLSSSIQPPLGCTSLLPTLATTTPAAATGTASASSGAASSTGWGHVSNSTTGMSSGLRKSAHSAKATTMATSTKGSIKTGSVSSSSAATSTPPTASTNTSTSAQTSTLASCSSPTERVEWRNMKSADQTALVDAIKCLMTTPPRSGLQGSKSRWDDMVVVHQQMASTIHGVGQFLAWHRQFIWIYEQELRNTCKYTGALPWWDETKDAGNFQAAPMMTSQLYGSAPDGNSTCVKNGKFGGAIMDIGPGSTDTPHCLARGVDEKTSSAVTNSFVDACNSWTDFNNMTDCVFTGPHAYTHDALGGDMSDLATAPNDPLFFLHHAFVDRNYRNWQLADAGNRTYAIAGWTTASCQSANGGNGCTDTTLNYVLSSLNFSPDVTAAQVADTQGGHLCYYYDY